MEDLETNKMAIRGYNSPVLLKQQSVILNSVGNTVVFNPIWSTQRAGLRNSNMRTGALKR